ncbi:MarR family winged helix-turn-helix transcriptional regulator [Thalassolituus sp. LLYu03]|uniref:MarR family winged helix-turn-helix transcriptional regulator n=1 Tax=Thalassolituus sp. LLYu03 TaxID=3421656 RepID=UPI003D266D0A
MAGNVKADRVEPKAVKADEQKAQRGAEAGLAQSPGSGTDTGTCTGIVALEYELATLARTMEALNRRRNYPLERAHYLLLLVLRDGPASIGTLAVRLLLDNSTVTRQVDAMQKKQLIEKIPNPDDGRSQLVVSSALGRSLVDDMQQVRVDRLTHTLADWSAAEQQQLQTLTRRLSEALARSLED